MAARPTNETLLAFLIDSGPLILVGSIVLVLIPLLLWRWPAAVAAAAGGALMYWGMYVQSDITVMYGRRGVHPSRKKLIVADEVTSGAIGRRRFAARLAGLAALFVVLALVSSACGSHGAAEPVGQTPKVSELRSVSELQDRFNEDSGAVRLILLMSPT